VLTSWRGGGGSGSTTSGATLTTFHWKLVPLSEPSLAVT
jgi:hypothetical protein